MRRALCPEMHVGKVNEACEKGSTIIVPQARLGEGHMRIAYQVTHMRTVQ
jgi:ribosomal protein L18E